MALRGAKNHNRGRPFVSPIASVIPLERATPKPGDRLDLAEPPLGTVLELADGDGTVRVQHLHTIEVDGWAFQLDEDLNGPCTSLMHWPTMRAQLGQCDTVTVVRWGDGAPAAH